MKKIGIQMLDKNRNITPKCSINLRLAFDILLQVLHVVCNNFLNTLVYLCLKSLLHSAKNKSIYDNKFHIRNDYYVIDNNEPVLDFINSDNLKKGGKSVSTYDFSTLYTSIPHDQLKNGLINFISRIFEVKNFNQNPKIG